MLNIQFWHPTVQPAGLRTHILVPRSRITLIQSVFQQILYGIRGLTQDPWVQCY